MASAVANLARLPSVGKLAATSSVLLCCDVQERFRNLIVGFDDVVRTGSFLVKVCNEMKVPIVVTEQYPRAFQHTVNEISSLLDAATKSDNTFEKTLFSMYTEAVKKRIQENGTKSAILFGIETHVCVQQTTLDLLEEGIDVHIVVDGVSSQRESDRKHALERLRQAGAFLTTAESVAFMLLQNAKNTHFKAVSAAIKENGGFQNMLGSL